MSKWTDGLRVVYDDRERFPWLFQFFSPWRDDWVTFSRHRSLDGAVERHDAISEILFATFSSRENESN